MSFSDVYNGIKEMQRIVQHDPESERETSQWELYSSANYMRDRISEAYTDYLRWSSKPQVGSIIHHPTPWESMADTIARCIMPSMKRQQLAAFLVEYGKLFGWEKREHQNVAVQELFDRLPGGRQFTTYGLEQSYEQHMRARLLFVPLGHKMTFEPREFGNGSQYSIWTLAKEAGAVGYADEGEQFRRQYALYFRSYADYVRGVDFLVSKRLDRAA